MNTTNAAPPAGNDADAFTLVELLVVSDDLLAPPPSLAFVLPMHRGRDRGRPVDWRSCHQSGSEMSRTREPA